MHLRGSFGSGQMAPQSKSIVRGGVDVQHQIPKRAGGDAVIKVQDETPSVGVHLHQNVPDTRFIARVLESNDVMGIAIDGLGKLAGWK